MRNPKGKGVALWGIYFSDETGFCDHGPLFPDPLSIRALNLIPDVGADNGPDTWDIGTFDGNGDNDPKRACLVKRKHDEFVGFFNMSFMYTIEIKPNP